MSMDTQLKLLLYPVADTFGVDLEADDSSFVGREEKELQAGPWRLRSDVRIVSDFVGLAEVGAWVKIKKQLWAYVWSRPHDLRLYLFPSHAVGLKTDFVSKFATGSAEESLAKIAKHIVVSFRFDEQSRKWEKHEAAGDLEQGPAVEGEGGAGADPSA